MWSDQSEGLFRGLSSNHDSWLCLDRCSLSSHALVNHHSYWYTQSDQSKGIFLGLSSNHDPWLCLDRCSLSVWLNGKGWVGKHLNLEEFSLSRVGLFPSYQRECSIILNEASVGARRRPSEEAQPFSIIKFKYT